jgi:hypothetical protein
VYIYALFFTWGKYLLASLKIWIVQLREIILKELTDKHVPPGDRVHDDARLDNVTSDIKWSFSAVSAPLFH